MFRFHRQGRLFRSIEVYYRVFFKKQNKTAENMEEVPRRGKPSSQVPTSAFVRSDARCATFKNTTCAGQTKRLAAWTRQTTFTTWFPNRIPELNMARRCLPRLRACQQVHLAETVARKHFSIRNLWDSGSVFYFTRAGLPVWLKETHSVRQLSWKRKKMFG